MSIYIIDASVAAKWFVQEEYGETALSILDESNRLHAPDFLLLELDSIICKWLRRGAINPAEGSELRHALRQYPIQLHPFMSLLDFAFAIAGQNGQSIYDCLYVALAALLKGTMITADRRLYDAMRSGSFQAHMAWIGDMEHRQTHL